MSETALPTILSQTLGDPLPVAEVKAWAALSPKQKLRAIRRLEALRRWHGERDGWTADDAADAASMPRSHFYTLAAKWEDVESRSLASLGVHAKAPRRRKSRYDAELMEMISSAADDLVATEPHEPKDKPPVTQVISRLRGALAHEERDLPGDATLRGVITEARRRLVMKNKVGGDLAFDICACDIPDPKGEPYIAYVCVDRGTGYILGFRFDNVSDSVSGHAGLAAQVLKDEAAGICSDLPWIGQTRTVELVIGEDLANFRKWEEATRAAVAQAGKSGPGGVNLQGTNAPRRFGHYLKEAVGTRIGRIQLLPARTVPRPGAPAPSLLTGSPYTPIEATMRLELEVADHNVAVRDQLADGANSGRMPVRVRSVFELIAKTNFE